MKKLAVLLLSSILFALPSVSWAYGSVCSYPVQPVFLASPVSVMVSPVVVGYSALAPMVLVPAVSLPVVLSPAFVAGPVCYWIR